MSVCFSTDTFLNGLTSAALLLDALSLAISLTGTFLFPSTVSSTILPSVVRSFLLADSRTLFRQPLSRGLMRAAASRTSSGCSVKDIEVVEQRAFGAEQRSVENVPALQS